MKITKTLAAGLSAVLLLVGSAMAQTCNNHIQAMAPDSRYTDHGDGTVTDTATGLMWKQCAEGLSGPGCGSGSPQTFTWQGALQQAEAATFAGYSDWRLPNVKELSSLVDRRCVGPAINLTRFPNTPSNWFWSSSPYAGSSRYARIVAFGYGGVGGYSRTNNFSVRLVRGGQ